MRVVQLLLRVKVQKMKYPQELGVVSPQKGGKDLWSRRVLRSRGTATERTGEFLHCGVF